MIEATIPWGRGELRVLVVDDEPDVRLGLRLLVESLAADVKAAASAEEALGVLDRWTPHLVLSDITMPGMSGIDLLRRVRATHPATRVVLITGFGSIEMAVSAMHGGASHFITKPFDNDDILAAVRRFGLEALADARASGRAGAEPAFIARDARMAPVLRLIDQVAPTAVSVLVQGESGVGKEIVARAIHERGPRRDRPFVAVNTAALPDSLLESELFGHTRGAFTGADRARKGVFEQADGGTVFLDEVGLMSPSFQTKLLRVLQERQVVPLGTARPQPVEFRLVAATGQDLHAAMRAGDFREDLYYRMCVVSIGVPPLRERPGDIAPLAAHFLARFADKPPHLSAAAFDALQRHSWPGNVRELENCIQRALVLSGGREIAAEHLGLGGDADAVWQPPKTGMTYEEGKQHAVRTFQRRFIEHALSRSSGNVSQAARVCGLTRAALQRIMRSLGVEREHFRT